MSDQTMAGRTVLVTGASDGIGAETARVLAAKGATVHVTGRSADKLRPSPRPSAPSLSSPTSPVSTTYAASPTRSPSVSRRSTC